jgi:hypothetical protein
VARTGPRSVRSKQTVVGPHENHSASTSVRDIRWYVVILSLLLGHMYMYRCSRDHVGSCPYSMYQTPRQRQEQQPSLPSATTPAVGVGYGGAATHDGAVSALLACRFNEQPRDRARYAVALLSPVAAGQSAAACLVVVGCVSSCP